MRRNYNDDFEDIIDQDLDYLPKHKPKHKKQQLDFFDDDPDPYTPNLQDDKVKLPRISTIKSEQKHHNNNPPHNYPPQPTLLKQTRSPLKSSSSIRSKQTDHKLKEQTYNYQLEPKIKQIASKVEGSEKQNIEDEPYNNYEDDFEDFQIQQPEDEKSKPASIYSQKYSQKQKYSARDILPPKSQKSYVSSQKPVPRIAKSTTKPLMPSKGTMKRSNSIRSFTSEGPSKKFTAEVQKQFSNLDLTKRSVDEVQKLNQKIRGMIRKMNEQLNLIINKAALQQKSGLKSNKKSVDSLLKVLNSEKNNNDKILQRQGGELVKARSKVGLVKDEDYEVRIDKQIEEMKKKKKQLDKVLEKINFDISHGYKRQGQSLDKRSIQIAKTQLVNLKKQNERSTVMSEQVGIKLQQMIQKSQSSDTRYNQIIRQAETKGISLDGGNAELETRYKQIEEKQKGLRKHITNLQSLSKTKQNIVQNDNQRLKRTLVALDSQIKDIYNQIVDLGQKSSSLIQRERENPKIMRNVISSLEKICHSIGEAPQWDRISRKTARSKTSSVQKSPSEKIQTKESPTPSTKQVEHNSDPNPFKPNFKKKKFQQKINKQEASQQVNNHEPLAQTPAIQTETQQKQPSTKPKFSFKKRKQANQQLNKQDPLPIVVEEKLDSSQIQKPHLQNEPKIMRPFMRLKRPGQQRQQSESGYSLSVNQYVRKEVAPNKTQILQTQNKQQPAKIAVQEVKQQNAAPKRFTLKRRGEPRQSENSGYNPTIKEDPPQVKEQKSSEPPSYSFMTQVQPQKQALPPRIRNFGNQKPKIQSEYQYNHNQNSSNPVSHSNRPASPPKIAINNEPKTFSRQSPSKFSISAKQPPATVIQESTNTYVPPPPREREGRIKKQKPAYQPTKISNIYSQAQDLSDAIFKNEAPAQNHKQNLKNFEEKEQELDLNKMLGVKKQKNEDDDDLLFQEKSPEKPKLRSRPAVSKQNDFFGFQI